MIKLDVTRKGYYEVWKSGIKVSQHSSITEGISKGHEIKSNNLNEKVILKQPNLEFDVELKLTGQEKIDQLKEKEIMYLQEIERLKTIIDNSSTIEPKEIKAFPGAEGFGKNTIGGRGGQIIYVTNLNDSGAGSLREAIEATFPRTVLFKVGGLITLSSSLVISDPNISILGQSAPGDGIALTVEGTFGIRPLQISTDEVIIRYLKIRVKSDREVNGVIDSQTDGIYIASGNNIIIDHCSVSFATDELIGINVLTANPVRNITIQYCMLTNAYGGSASKAALCARDIEGLTFFRNLFASNITRNPYISVQDSNPDFDLYYEVINNVMYNTKYYIEATRDDSVDNGGLGVPQYNIINNYAKLSTGAPFAKNAERQMILNYSDLPVSIYAKGNIHPLRPTITNNVDYTNYTVSDWTEEWSTTQGGDGIANLNNTAFAGHQAFIPKQTPIIIDNVSLYDADVLWNSIKDDIGASFPSRDSHDVQMVNEVETGERADNTTAAPLPIYNNPLNNTPYTDLNNDGIEDDWFAANVPNGDTGNDISPNGYTWVENYLNEISNGQIPDIPAESVAVTPDVVDVDEGDTIQLTVSFLPADTSDKSGSWSSNNANATVDNTGVVTGVSSGTSLITFTSTDGGFTDTSTVTVNPAIVIPELYMAANALSRTNETNATTGISGIPSSSVAMPTPLDGSYMLSIGGNVGNVSTSVSVEIGKTYEVKYYAYVDGSSGGYSNAWINATGSAYHDFTTTPTEYTQTVVAAGTSMIFRFYCSYGNAVYIDGLSVKEI